jgi:4'-phosphopantetheinyl transferase EntD
MIDRLFPKEVVSVVATEAMWSARLHPEEERCVERASSKRRREFAAGRACARAALARLGLPDVTLGRHEDRTPRWPPGIVGSIAHCTGFCAAAVARREAIAGLGLDVERSGRVTEALLPRVCTPAEREAIAQLSRSEGEGATDWRTIVFSAKESTYKCYHPLTGAGLGFHDVEIELDPRGGRFSARLLRADAPSAHGARAFPGRFASRGGLVSTGITLTAGPGGAA